jgi:hypothetical protein
MPLSLSAKLRGNGGRDHRRALGQDPDRQPETALLRLSPAPPACSADTGIKLAGRPIQQHPVPSSTEIDVHHEGQMRPSCRSGDLEACPGAQIFLALSNSGCQLASSALASASSAQASHLVPGAGAKEPLAPNYRQSWWF